MPECSSPGGKCCAVHTQHPVSLCWSLRNIQPSLNLWPMTSRSVFEDKQLAVIWVKEITCKTAFFPHCFSSFYSLPTSFRLWGPVTELPRALQSHVCSTWGTRNCESSVGWGALARRTESAQSW